MTNVTEEKMPQVEPLSPAQNAAMALEQMRSNMAPQMDVQKFNLLRFGYEYLLQYIEEQYKKELAANAPLTNASSQATPSDADAATIVPAPCGEPTESPSIL